MLLLRHPPQLEQASRRLVRKFRSALQKFVTLTLDFGANLSRRNFSSVVWRNRRKVSSMPYPATDFMSFSSFKEDSQFQKATNASVSHKCTAEGAGAVRGIDSEQGDSYAYCEEGSCAQPGLQEAKVTDIEAEEAAYGGEDGQGCCESGM